MSDSPFIDCDQWYTDEATDTNTVELRNDTKFESDDPYYAPFVVGRPGKEPTDSSDWCVVYPGKSLWTAPNAGFIAAAQQQVVSSDLKVVFKGTPTSDDAAVSLVMLGPNAYALKGEWEGVTSTFPEVDWGGITDQSGIDGDGEGGGDGNGGEGVDDDDDDSTSVLSQYGVYIAVGLLGLFLLIVVVGVWFMRRRGAR